jgi:hypothetical protein
VRPEHPGCVRGAAIGELTCPRRALRCKLS